MDTVALNLLAGWLGVLAGVLSGAAIGIFFHNEAWLGGYGSFRRRMTRLGHIAFFGLGFINLMFAFSARAVELPPLEAKVASYGFLVGLVAMPLCCFLTAWRLPFRHLFFIPVVAVATGVIALVKGLPVA
ncbi:MAG TPA: hypothetical protein VNU64_11630 [Burkholderiales bacterium]|nr:hypothetical protein [Burkholderiales bacterium]